MPATHLIHGDARALPLRDRSVQCVVTSPPYWGLRDYGLPPSVWGGDPDHAHEWGADIVKTGPAQGMGKNSALAGRTAYETGELSTRGANQGAFCPCGAWRGVLGLEPTPELYVAHLVAVFREVRRVLRDDGTCWVNLGDSYNAAGRVGHGTRVGYKQGTNRASANGADHTRPSAMGLKEKDLVGIPWRVAFALQADGWWLRSDIVWAKPNPMPESITDRPTKAHEYVFLLAKSARYYYDNEAVREPHTAPERQGQRNTGWDYGDYNAGNSNHVLAYNPGGRNRRTVWTIATEPYPEAHFATFPEKLVEPCILAGTSARGACPACGAPWARDVEAVSPDGRRAMMKGGKAYDADGKPLIGDNMIDAGVRGSFNASRGVLTRETLGWSPSCACPPAEPVPCRVLDPFSGSGTTVAVAERLWRTGIGLELKPDYVALARKRNAQISLF